MPSLSLLIPNMSISDEISLPKDAEILMTGKLTESRRSNRISMRDMAFDIAQLYKDSVIATLSKSRYRGWPATLTATIPSIEATNVGPQVQLLDALTCLIPVMVTDYEKTLDELRKDLNDTTWPGKHNSINEAKAFAHLSSKNLEAVQVERGKELSMFSSDSFLKEFLGHEAFGSLINSLSTARQLEKRVKRKNTLGKYAAHTLGWSLLLSPKKLYAILIDRHGYLAFLHGKGPSLEVFRNLIEVGHPAVLDAEVDAWKKLRDYVDPSQLESLDRVLAERGDNEAIRMAQVKKLIIAPNDDDDEGVHDAIANLLETMKHFKEANHGYVFRNYNARVVSL